MNTTTTHEDSILSDVEDVSTEQRDGSESEASSGDVQPKGYSKHVTQTNQSLGEYGELMSVLLTPEKIDEIRDENPELAQRLAKSKRFGKHFQGGDEAGEDDEERMRRIASEVVGVTTKESKIENAMSQLTVEGKHLNSADLEVLHKNETYSKTLNGFLGAGFSEKQAVQKAFKEAYPTKVSTISTSFMSAPSEYTERKVDNALDKISKKYNDPNDLPNFLKKAKKV